MAITDFHLLLLEDDPAKRDSLLRAAAEAGVATVRALGNGADARAYFDELAQGRLVGGRSPSVFMLDLERREGLDLLAWVRSRPQLRRLVTIGLIGSQDGRWIGRAYDLHVNSCLVRPDHFAGQVDLFRSLRKYWERLNQAPGL
jgi:CheY-like chemotaxis protein